MLPDVRKEAIDAARSRQLYKTGNGIVEKRLREIVGLDLDEAAPIIERAERERWVELRRAFQTFVDNTIDHEPTGDEIESALVTLRKFEV